MSKIANLPEFRILFGVPVHATTVEMRALYVRVTNSGAFREWDAHAILTHGNFDAFDPKALALAEKVSALYIALRDEVLLAIADMEAQRAKDEPEVAK